MKNLDKQFEDIELLPEGRENESGKPLVEQVSLALWYIDVLWSARTELFRRALLTGVFVFGLMFLVPSEYTAKIELTPPDMNPTSGLSLLIGLKSGLSSLGGMSDLLGARSPGELYIREMQSRIVEDRIVDRFDLMRHFKSRRRVDARKILEENTDFDEDKKSGVITVSYTDPDPVLASKIANSYAEELGQVLSNLASSAGKREREYFEQQVLAARRDLEDATRGLASFSASTGVIDVPEQGKAIIASGAAIEGELVATKSELKGLQEIYSDRHERVQAAKARVRELQKELDLLKGRGTSTVQADNVQSLSNLATPYLEKFRTMKMREAVLETVEQQYQFSKLEEARHVSEVQVLSPAEVPEKKSGPHRARVALIAVVLMLVGLSSSKLARRAWSDMSEENAWKQLLRPRIEAAFSSFQPILRIARTILYPFRKLDEALTLKTKKESSSDEAKDERPSEPELEPITAGVSRTNVSGRDV